MLMVNMQFNVLRGLISENVNLLKLSVLNLSSTFKQKLESEWTALAASVLVDFMFIIH